MVLTLRDRFAGLPAAHPAEGLMLVAGGLGDYHTLAEHHYRAARPATAVRVLVLRERRPSVVGRYFQRHDQTRNVGVLVESLPSLNCRLRDWALHERYGTWLSPTQRARMMSEELRCISRVVVHPQWRGLGLAVRLVRAALGQPTTIFTEALAAMGRVNPFFEHAGMTAHRRPAHACDARLIAALGCAGLRAEDLAMLAATRRRIEALESGRRRWLLKELHRWYRQNGGRAARHSGDPMDRLRAAQQRLLLEPVYYIHDNRGKVG